MGEQRGQQLIRRKRDSKKKRSGRSLWERGGPASCLREKRGAGSRLKYYLKAGNLSTDLESGGQDLKRKGGCAILTGKGKQVWGTTGNRVKKSKRGIWWFVDKSGKKVAWQNWGFAHNQSFVARGAQESGRRLCQPNICQRSQKEGTD